MSARARGERFLFAGVLALILFVATLSGSLGSGYSGGSGLGSGGSTYPLTIVAQTADATLSANTFNSNAGASGDIQLTLPSAPSTGVVEQVFVTVNHYAKIKAPASTVVYFGTTSCATAGYWRSTSIGSTAFLVYLGSNTWLAVATGTWTADS